MHARPCLLVLKCSAATGNVEVTFEKTGIQLGLYVSELLLSRLRLLYQDLSNLCASQALELPCASLLFA
eukprot:1635671-Amphidinium_carterae.2